LKITAEFEKKYDFDDVAIAINKELLLMAQGSIPPQIEKISGFFYRLGA
jgi:hypothetical protein